MEVILFLIMFVWILLEPAFPYVIPVAILIATFWIVIDLVTASDKTNERQGIQGDDSDTKP